MKKKVFGGGVAAVLLLGACTHVVISTPADNQELEEGGFVYSLPMGQVYLQAARTEVTDDDVAKAKSAVEAAKKALLKSQAAVKTATSDNMPSAQAALELDQSTLTQAIKTANSLKAHTWIESISLSVLPVVADPDARYSGTLNHGSTRDDNLKLTIVRGLLNTTTVTSTDQTPNILVTIADTAVTIASGGFHPFSRPATPPPAPTCEKFSFAWVFDPFDDSAHQAVVDALRDKGASFTIAIGAGAKVGPIGKREASVGTAKVKGLAYRAATPVAIAVVKDVKWPKAQCALDSSPSAQSWQAIVPDTRSHYHVSSIAGPFTTTSLAYGFTDGMLTDYSVQRPSEVAAIAGVPVRIANSIMTIPASLLRLRVDYDTASVARINGDAAVKAAQTQQAATMLAAESAVVNAQAALASARIGEQTSLANAQTALVNALEQLRAAKATAATNSAATGSP